MNTPHPHSIHNSKFGPHFRIVVSTADDGGMFVEYTHHGIDLRSDPDGKLMREAFRLAKRYGKPPVSGPNEQEYIWTWTAAGYGISAYKRGGRTYFEISKGRWAYALDASAPGGPFEQYIEALRRRFPALRTD